LLHIVLPFFGLVLLPFCFHSANLNFKLSAKLGRQISLLVFRLSERLKSPIMLHTTTKG